MKKKSGGGEEEQPREDAGKGGVEESETLEDWEVNGLNLRRDNGRLSQAKFSSSSFSLGFGGGVTKECVVSVCMCEYTLHGIALHRKLI